MRLFLHLVAFTPEQLEGHQLLQPIKKDEENDNSKTIVLLSVGNVSTTDELIQIIGQKLQVDPSAVVIKLIIKHQTQYKKINIVKGFSFNTYQGAHTEEPSTLKYQLQLQVIQLLPSQGKKNSEQKEESSDTSKAETTESPQIVANLELYKYHAKLFQHANKDELQEFTSLTELLAIKFSTSELVTILNFFEQDSGYTLLHYLIYKNKYQCLQVLVKQYARLLDFNLKSVDGWLPAQLALTVQNRNAIQLFINYQAEINLDLNCSSEYGQIVFNLIDTVNIDLISKVVKKFPIKFEDIHQKHRVNVYDYVWNHHRLAQTERKELIQLMHQKHVENYDVYRWDQILYTTVKKYLPQASRKVSPTKHALIINPNLKIISGEIIKCKNTVFFSKYVFLSVNPYIGAIQQYEVNNKLKLVNDKEKLDEYSKDMHLSFQEIQSVYLLDQKEKSWFLKKEWFCFVIKEKRDNKIIYACNHEYTANQWVDQIKQAIKAWEKRPEQSIPSKSQKKYVHISDVEYKSPEPAKKRFGTNKMIEFFSSKHSVCESQTPLYQKTFSMGKELQGLKSKSQYNSASTQKSSEMSINEPPHSLKYKDFKFLRMLGEGSFGQVYLVECHRNKKLYALKVFQKKKIILSKQTKFVIAEVNILKQINHPFIISLYFTFQTPNFIYLGLQYCQGKDLAKHLNQEMTFDQDDVRLYTAEIVLALEYLHGMGIIYRDLKPQNIMLGKDGHVLLVDFGLSKKTQNNFAKTFCGSPAYLSPEMLDRHGVGPESDFFTLGVVIYEFMFGEPPFFADNIHLLYENIQNGKIKFPRKINENTYDFLTKLLQKDPKCRLGSRTIEDIKNHSYFQGLDWGKVERKEYPGPKRQLLGALDDQQMQEHQDLIKIFHDDFDYSEQNYKINRFKNFSFRREEQFS